MHWIAMELMLSGVPGNNTIIKFLIDENGRLVKGQDDMCEAHYKYFTKLLGKTGTLDHSDAWKTEYWGVRHSFWGDQSTIQVTQGRSTLWGLQKYASLVRAPIGRYIRQSAAEWENS